jgi:hypothetical protein
MNLRYLAIATCMLIFSSCATRTPYQSYAQNGGYIDGKYDDGTRYSRFAGNAYTHKDYALWFSLFRALEVCNNSGYKYTRILGSRDLSATKDIQRTSTYNYNAPTYYSGNANTNFSNYGNSLQANTNYNGTIYGGDQTSNSKSWTETLTFPIVDTGFDCLDSLFRAKIKFRELKEDDVKSYVKDLRGALQVEDIPEDSPNKEKIKNSDIVLRLNGERVWTVSEFVKILNNSNDKENLKFDLIRDGKKMSIRGRAVDSKEELISEAEKIKATACGIQDLKENLLCQLRYK